MLVQKYTGVGSRETPDDIQKLMIDIAKVFARNGTLFRSGGADGADSAFERGCDSQHGPKEVYYARDSTAEAELIASTFHPAWHRCSAYAKKLHGRNAFEVLGRSLDDPSDILLCWTPDGCIRHADRSQVTGGTGTAISIADNHHVRIFNLYRTDHADLWKTWLRTNQFSV